jgi:hypothetical protein
MLLRVIEWELGENQQQHQLAAWPPMGAHTVTVARAGAVGETRRRARDGDDGRVMTGQCHCASELATALFGF